MSAKKKGKARKESKVKKLVVESKQEGDMNTTPVDATPVKSVNEKEAALSCVEVIEEIEALRNSTVITFFAKEGVSMGSDVCDVLYDQLRNIGKVEKIDLFLHSTGGATEVPWRIITLLRGFCKKLGVMIPRKALSAATHIALGADEIIMGDGSELSPVDPSRTHPLLPKDEKERPLAISVQDLKHCVEFIRRGGTTTEREEETATTKYESADLASIYVTLFQYVHPLALGAIEQSYALAKLISRKLLSTHMVDKKEAQKIADRLSDEFKSHNYLIGWKEAKDDLGLKVKFDDGVLMDKMLRLYDIYTEQTKLERAIKQAAGAKGLEVKERPILWIDTKVKRVVRLEAFTLETDKSGMTIGKIVGGRWVKIDIK